MWIAGTEDNQNPAPGFEDRENPVKALQRIPIRYLAFHEDVRPPYIGTYTKDVSQRLFRNPFARLRSDTDYDYDSEAEWEESEDGEDVDLDSESEGETPSEMDDMEEFLDDADADGQPVRTKLLAADLEPISSGLCFEDHGGTSRNTSGATTGFRIYRLESLLGTHRI